MPKKLQQTIKPLLKTFFVLSLVLALALSHAEGALAAHNESRMSGGSPRASSSHSHTPHTYGPPGARKYFAHYHRGGFSLFPCGVNRMCSM